MKHPNHDISVYIHSDICKKSGHCTCPSEEETTIKDQVVSCRIRGLIGNSWNYRVFINLTQYEIEKLADYERFYTLVVTSNNQRIEQRCIDRRDSSTIFVLRPDKDSNPQYIHQSFPENTNESHFSGPGNWLIEIKVSYGQVATGRSSLLTRRPTQNHSWSGPLAEQEAHISESNEVLLVHFKFIGGPLSRLEPLEVPNLGPQLPRETSTPDTMNIGDSPEASSSNQLTDNTLPENSNWDWSRRPTITVQYSNAGLEAVSRFAVDPDFVSIVDEQSQDTSLIISTGTADLCHPQPRRDLTKLANRWEELPDQNPGCRVDHDTGLPHLGLELRSRRAFDQTGHKAPRAFSIARRIRDLRARFDKGLDILKENDRYPWEEDHASNYLLGKPEEFGS